MEPDFCNRHEARGHTRGNGYSLPASGCSEEDTSGIGRQANDGYGYDQGREKCREAY